MVKKVVDVEDDVWTQFERIAVMKFGLYGSIKKGTNEAIAEWVVKNKDEIKRRAEKAQNTDRGEGEKIGDKQKLSQAEEAYYEKIDGMKGK